MKMTKNLSLFTGLWVLSLLVPFVSFAQERTLTGTVVDEFGTPLPGVSVIFVGTTTGAATDFNGQYRLTVPNDVNEVKFSYIGYLDQVLEVGAQSIIDVTLQPDSEQLEEVVVIGYGSAKKEDLTGSVTAINASDFNQGAITSPQDLLNGKVSGVQITTGGGAPGAGSTIRIRGGASLNASNDPLIIIDGVPLDNDGVSGMRNPLNTINPNDIETFNVLKDASATAIYGSRASNGVILITTKKGQKGKLSVDYTGTVSVAKVNETVDVLTADEYRSFMSQNFPQYAEGGSSQLLGSANTDWQDQVFRTAVSTDHNVAVSGAVKDMIPFRLSVGYNNSQGVLEQSDMERTTVALNLTPKFFDDHLSTNASIKFVDINNSFSNEGAIGSATAFDPTQPVKSSDAAYAPYGGYYTWLDAQGTPMYSIAPGNPVAMIDQRTDVSDVMRSIGNIQLDYKFHFLPKMRANLNMGYDYSKSRGNIAVSPEAGFDAGAVDRDGSFSRYEQIKRNELLDFYLQYADEISGLDLKYDVMGGYSYQYFRNENENWSTFGNGEQLENWHTLYKQHNNLQSFFGRANFNLKEKYLVTATLRADGSSKFNEDNRWGIFPAVALGWKLDKENFMAGATAVSQLKLRAGWGITGQQDIGPNFGYMPIYVGSQPDADYSFYNPNTGEWVTVPTNRPSGYDQNLKWEETTTWNVGFDFGFFDDKITGTLEGYYRNTKDLLNYIPVPAGSNLTNMLTTNVGNMTNKGVEFNINTKLVQTKDFFWDLGLNATYNENEITKLTLTDDPNYEGVRTGGVAGGMDIYAQRHKVGYPASSFFLYEQVYDESGKPMEGIYKDQNGDGKIDESDLVYSGNPAPKWMFGFTSKMTYKNWDFSVAGRAYLGGMVYNNVASEKGHAQAAHTSGQVATNVHYSAMETDFQSPQLLSDYYLESGNFFRLDNIMVGYNFFNLFDKDINARVYGTVNNVYLGTQYSGIDPEIFGGMDQNMYPRPTTYMMGVNLSF
ncbi:SusC/RagA family TonB-linked outer membrane protein [Sediminitomix flava]|nr:TonB-dependent receptor [Sediminitomix flava]